MILKFTNNKKNLEDDKTKNFMNSVQISLSTSRPLITTPIGKEGALVVVLVMAY